MLRRTSLGGNARLENSAEHSWHIAMMVPVLAEYSPWPIDPLRVTQMLLVHDVVEIDAGDTFAFDTAAHHDKEQREQAAAERIFGLLPADQAAQLRGLWQEFEAAESPDARFAQALDRLGGVLQNALNDGGTWIEHGVSREAVLKRQEPIRDALPDLWPWVVELTDRVLR